MQLIRRRNMAAHIPDPLFNTADVLVLTIWSSMINSANILVVMLLMYKSVLADKWYQTVMFLFVCSRTNDLLQSFNTITAELSVVAVPWHICIASVITVLTAGLLSKQLSQQLCYKTGRSSSYLVCYIWSGVVVGEAGCCYPFHAFAHACFCLAFSVPSCGRDCLLRMQHIHIMQGDDNQVPCVAFSPVDASSNFPLFHLKIHAKFRNFWWNSLT